MARGISALVVSLMVFHYQVFQAEPVLLGVLPLNLPANIKRARSAADIERQGPWNAFLAAFTASSMSAAPASYTSIRVSPVAGLGVENVLLS